MVTLCSRYGTAAGKLTRRNSCHSAKIWSHLSKRDYENQFTISKEQPESSNRTRGVPSWNLHSIHQKRFKLSRQWHPALTAQVRWIKGLKWWLVPATCKLGQKESVQTQTTEPFSLRDADPSSSEHWRSSNLNLTSAAQDPYFHSRTAWIKSHFVEISESSERMFWCPLWTASTAPTSPWHRGQEGQRAVKEMAEIS